MRVRWGRVFALLFVLGVVGLVALCALTNWVQRSGVLEGLVPGGPGEQGATPAPRRPPPIGQPGATEGAGGAPVGEVPAGRPFRVLTVPYTPYLATLGLMDARGYMERRGYDLQLVNAYGPDVDLDEEGQCRALSDGDYEALATTLDATRKCGAGVAIGIPVGQSAGNDAIVVKSGVRTWNDVFEHAVAFTGYSVSEYMACFASHTANQPMKLPLRYDDASAAVDAWLNSGAEQDIQSVVAWQPEVARALAEMPGSRVILSSDEVRILWDVIEFSQLRMAEDEAAFQAFTDAYYEALLEVSRDPQAAFAAIQSWSGQDPGRQDLLTVQTGADFVADLENEAFATLRDAAILMQEMQTIRNRLEEAGFYWTYCGVSVPPVSDLTSLVVPRFVLAARSNSALLGGPEERPSSKVFQVTDFTDASAVTDEQMEAARLLFETGVEIEFLPNRADFRDPEAAGAALANAVRFLRTCRDCVLEIQGGAAYPGERVCPGCRREDSDALAVQRGLKVYDELRLRFDVPEGQLRFIDQPRPPQYPGSDVEEELRRDRRTFLTGYQLAGR